REVKSRKCSPEQELKVKELEQGRRERLSTGMASPDLTQELTCPICLEIFTQPVSLDCGHHFCSSCISQSWQKVPGDVSCPQCRQVFTQRNVRPALTLINIVERFREQKVKVTQPQEEFYCQEHEEKLKLFCEDEHKAICLVCGMSRAHKTHSVIPIKEAAQIYKNKLETSLETLQKQMDLSLHSKREREDGILHMKAEVDRLRNEINSEFEKMHKFLFEKEELLKAELERKSNKVFEEIESNLTKTMDELSSLEGAIRDLKSRLEVQEAPEFLKDIQDLLMRSQMEFHKPGTVSTQLPADIAGEPVKYIKVWREMRAAISPGIESDRAGTGKERETLSTGMASPDLTQELTCPICLEIFTQPVSLECGHHFCSSCISQSWQEVPGDVSCPQCRQVFTQRNVRPALTLNNIVERFRGQKVKVTQPQEEFYCQEHEEKLKLFCEDEHKAICLVCGMSSAHKTHRVIPIKEAAQIYKNKLETSLETLQKQMDLSLHSKREREDGILHMKAEVDRLRNEINSEFEKMHKFLVEKEELLKAELERKSNKVFEEMESNLTKTMAEMSSVEGAIRDLKSRLAVQEAPEFLKVQNLFVLSSLKKQFCDAITPVSLTHTDFQTCFYRSQMKFHKPGTVSTQLPADIAGEPVKYIKVWREMRAAISPVPASLTLDPETANNQLIISQDLTSVRHGNEQQARPDHPNRFTDNLYVLSSQSFTSGRHYWEVGLGNKPYWIVGVCRESVTRKANITRSPENGFWVIARYPNCKSLKIPDVISQRKVKPRKLGIYLDYEGGQVSFYDAEDVSHLYTFTDTFTEKLYPIVNPCNHPDPLTLLTG
ncbi:E3 ubiquitin-protein ligase TRIM39-like, partial [Scyliorhinus torazame]|uniref:E3 ubiquitin-protein ligase TRIM39-like n=1 Tax=Scyliorhinus torazame TaxID=75743 RepID=UPI003B5CAEBF